MGGGAGLDGEAGKALTRARAVIHRQQAQERVGGGKPGGRVYGFEEPERFFSDDIHTGCHIYENIHRITEVETGRVECQVRGNCENLVGKAKALQPERAHVGMRAQRMYDMHFARCG